MGSELVQILPAGASLGEGRKGRGENPSKVLARQTVLPTLPSRTETARAVSSERTFYIETFGCQMNVHDSEKVSGVLMGRGYRPVENHEEANLILYNTCSIREKAAQKVFSRLGTFKKGRHYRRRIIGVLGCVAQQEGEGIFDRAPQVSLVCGSASYSRLPELLARLETGDRHVAGLSLE